MKRVAGIAVALVAAALCGGCGLSLFEDVGTDPHPPEISLIGLAYQPPQGDDGKTPPPVLLPPTGITVQAKDPSQRKLLLRVAYRDAGADLASFTVRDRDGRVLLTVIPQAADTGGDAPLYFLGVSGVADLEDVEVVVTEEGDHRFEVWAEDSHESRSAKVGFTVTVQL